MYGGGTITMEDYPRYDYCLDELDKGTMDKALCSPCNDECISIIKMQNFNK